MTHAPHIPGHHDNSWQLYVMCLQACFLAEFRFLNLFDHIPWMLFSYGCLECLLSSFNNQTYIILIILLHLLVLDAISRCCHTKSAWRFVHVRMKKRFKPRVVFSVSLWLMIHGVQLEERHLYGTTTREGHLSASWHSSWTTTDCRVSYAVSKPNSIPWVTLGHWSIR